MPKAKEQKKELQKVNKVNLKEIYELAFDTAIDAVSNQVNMPSVNLKRGNFVIDSISTGSLAIDLAIGGGFPPSRWVTIYGKEMAGKSTLVMGGIKDSTSRKYNVHYFDHEQSISPDYAERMGIDLKKVSGSKEEKVWRLHPYLRYYQPDFGEQTFTYIKKVCRILPDKIKEGNKWYLIFNMEETKQKEIVEKLIKNGMEPVFKNKRIVKFEAFDGGVQAVFFMDSYPTMQTQRIMEDDDASSRMAEKAGMFADHAPKIRARIARKRINIIGTNQIRMNPGMKFGNPEYEPMGDTIKHLSDIRIKITPEGQTGSDACVTEEQCWDELGIDKYRFSNILVVKNKVYPPFKRTKIRIWFQEKGESGRGIDPVWDVRQYLEDTGQWREKKRNKFKIKLDILLFKEDWTWKEFKYLVLNPNKLECYKKFKFRIEEIDKMLIEEKGKTVEIASEKDEKKKEKLQEELTAFQKTLKKKVNFKLNLSRICRKQIETGKAFRLHFKAINKIKAKKKGEKRK